MIDPLGAVQIPGRQAGACQSALIIYGASTSRGHNGRTLMSIPRLSATTNCHMPTRHPRLLILEAHSHSSRPSPDAKPAFLSQCVERGYPAASNRLPIHSPCPLLGNSLSPKNQEFSSSHCKLPAVRSQKTLTRTLLPEHARSDSRSNTRTL